MDNQKDQNPCCPRDNEGNIVNISSCCDKNEGQKTQDILYLRKKTNVKHAASTYSSQDAG